MLTYVFSPKENDGPFLPNWRSCKILASCVIFSRKQRNFLHILLSVIFSETVEILHIPMNFNAKKDQITDIGAFPLVYCD